jgi:hypothetical protein
MQGPSSNVRASVGESPAKAVELRGVHPEVAFVFLIDAMQEVKAEAAFNESDVFIQHSVTLELVFP